MPRYIDADNITFDISGLVYIDPYDYKQIAFYFLKQLDEMPSADVVEVVRCKDCEYGIVPDQDGNLKSMFCYNRNGLDAQVRDNDYCSYAERRTE